LEKGYVFAAVDIALQAPRRKFMARKSKIGGVT
jgi:hypothetical protein